MGKSIFLREIMQPMHTRESTSIQVWHIDRLTFCLVPHRKMCLRRMNEKENSKNDQRLATMLQSIGRRYVIKVGAKKAIFAVLVAIIDDMSPYPAAGHLNMQI